jgi:hypothetical protein
MSHPNLAPHEWFRAAVYWYVEKHQGCPWCGCANCVYKREHDRVTEYHCGSCDFFVCKDRTDSHYHMGPGQERRAAVTMPAI